MRSRIPPWRHGHDSTRALGKLGGLGDAQRAQPGGQRGAGLQRVALGRLYEGCGQLRYLQRRVLRQRLLLAVVCLGGALYMTRSRPNTVYTSAQASALVNQGYFSDMNWTWGGQGTLGYRFGCNCEWAVQGTYWGLAESTSDGGPGITGPYVTPMTMGLTSLLDTTGGLPANGGLQTANNYTDQSPDHHTWRNWDVQDVEINVVRTLLRRQLLQSLRRGLPRRRALVPFPGRHGLGRAAAERRHQPMPATGCTSTTISPTT